MNRATINVRDLRIPDCGRPRPGEPVAWYQGRARYEGTLVGHDVSGRPYIANAFGTHSTAPSYDSVRLLDPFSRGGPNWLRLRPEAAVLRPTIEERGKFEVLLAQRIPPGPAYIEVIREIWARGHEVYVVGGTVRDVIAGDECHDVDLVTTMPVFAALPLITEMYGDEVSSSAQNGYIRMGGRPHSGDPFIDFSVFKRQFIGSASAIFSDDFDYDVGNRDFACNAVYYDPINEVYIDPTGRGIGEATNRILSLVTRADLRNPFHLAQICIRFLKFRCRGYTCSDECTEAVINGFLPYLGGMKFSARGNYIRTQVLSKSPPVEHVQRLQEFRMEFESIFGLSHYAQFVEPLEEMILSQ